MRTIELIEMLHDQANALQQYVDAEALRPLHPGLTDEDLEHLREIYITAFIEANYDPYNQKSFEAAVKIWPHIKALNEKFRFRT